MKSFILLLFFSLTMAEGQKMDYNSQLKNQVYTSVTGSPYLAKNNGSGDTLAAFTNAIAATSTIFVPNGTYNLSAPLVITKSNFKFICESNKAILQSTAATAVDSVVTIGAAERVIFDGCGVRGNSNVSRAIRANFCNDCQINYVDAKDAVTLFYINNSVTLDLNMPGGSAASGAWVYEPSFGIDIVSSNIVHVKSPRIEYMALSKRATNYPGGVGVGIRSVGSTAISITGGTSESNNIGVQLDSATYANTVELMDNEDNISADLEDSGTRNINMNNFFAGSCSSTCGSSTNVSVHYTAAASRGITNNMRGSKILIDAGSGVHGPNSLYFNDLGNNACCIVDNTTTGKTVKFGNMNCCGGGQGPLDDVLVSNLFMGTAGGGNTKVMVLGQPRSEFGFNTASECSGAGTGCSGASANNALTAILLKPDGSLVTVQAGLEITIYLGHTLQAGANTLNLNNTGAVGIFKPTTTGNLTVGYAGSGAPITMKLAPANVWYVMGAQ